MYITIAFSVLLLAIMLAWFGKRDRAVIVFTVSLILATLTFIHHMTDSIGLSL